MATDADADGIQISGLRKVFIDSSRNEVAAIDGVDLEIGGGEFWVLLGASGCGKTTMLRCLAGLETPDEGAIRIGSHGERRSGRAAIGMVFQSYALWPHMTVFQNVAYPLTTGPRRSRRSKRQIAERVGELLELMGLSQHAHRKINQLSGGQQQRVALARAIAPGSKVVLFDEPLSNIDAKVREQLRRDIKAMQRRLGFTAVYVTHDQAEAFELADRIAVMNLGKVVQIGTGRELYEEPTNRFVAEFVGAANSVDGTVVSARPGVVETSIGKIKGETAVGLSAGDQVSAFSRPHHWWIGLEPREDANAWNGSYVGTTHLGSYDEHIVDLNGAIVRVWTGVGAAEVPAALGDPVWVGVVAEHVRLLP